MTKKALPSQSPNSQGRLSLGSENTYKRKEISMFRNMLSRSWLSVIRKPSRTVILIIILFVMANMMLATIAIKSAVSESVQYAKETLGGEVYLQADMEALRAEAEANMGADGTMSGGRMQIERPTISIETANTIADSEYVRDYAYSVQASANASSYQLIETEESEMRRELEERMGNAEMPSGMFGSGGGFAFSTGDTTIVGINSFAFISDVEAGNMELAEGEIFDESSTDGVMISADLALENDLKVGDSITLKTTDDAETEITLHIVGTFDNTTDNYDPNTIYTNIETAGKFSSDEMGAQSVKYYLVNAEDKDAFVAEALQKYPTLEEDGLLLDIDTSAYDQMVGPIESVGGFATTILWVVIVASVVIITLIVTINVKDRRQEMGTLMSLGATKMNILGQILVELVLVATVGFVLSIPTGTVIAGAMGSGLLDSQIAMNEEQSTQNFGRGQNAGRPDFGGMGGGPMGATNQQNADVEAIDEIDVSASVSDYLLLFTAGYAIVILALILPSVNILRYQPKTILSGKE